MHGFKELKKRKAVPVSDWFTSACLTALDFASATRLSASELGRAVSTMGERWLLFREPPLIPLLSLTPPGTLGLAHTVGPSREGLLHTCSCGTSAVGVEEASLTPEMFCTARAGGTVVDRPADFAG